MSNSSECRTGVWLSGGTHHDLLCCDILEDNTVTHQQPVTLAVPQEKIHSNEVITTVAF